ncbi:MAG: 4Fe-4S dicluster domain-containing protein [Planctomycetes bacterium]|nr:4Fe-4S dicluster domain-containing protein [Planctomycetota bacterium]
MQYGFVIDHDKCIGCHACTVACKAENDVPVGDFRTWVKYTEVGQFPDVKRNFAVLRCNQCTDAPCVTICPVNALEKRIDGIVDVDRDACIGCKACMQACPYDALYLNEDLGAVEKCHFCAHRVDNGLEPACVVVCPVQAIIAGDLHNPNSKPSKLIAENETVVRRPEQGTKPNVHYIGVDKVALSPGKAARPETYIWSDRPPHKPEPWPVSVLLEPNSMTVLDVGHKVQWGWPVALYLLTKSIAAGAALLAPFAAMFGLVGFGANYFPEIVALSFTALTCLLLIEDLAKPLMFFRMLTRPNFKSWLVKGGIVLTIFGLLVTLALVLRLLKMQGAADAVRIFSAITAIAAAGYTAFLFAQCKGRDLWEGKLLLPHLLVQALVCGSVCFLTLAPSSLTLKLIFAISIVAHLVFALAERYGGHETDNARQAAAFLTIIRIGPLKAFRDGLILAVLLSLLLVFIIPQIVFIPALLGLFCYEYAYIRAAQLPPLS